MAVQLEIMLGRDSGIVSMLMQIHAAVSQTGQGPSSSTHMSVASPSVVSIPSVPSSGVGAGAGGEGAGVGSDPPSLSMTPTGASSLHVQHTA